MNFEPEDGWLSASLSSLEQSVRQLQDLSHESSSNQEHIVDDEFCRFAHKLEHGALVVHPHN